jgi:two-component system response regulator PilR (NtrC family)
MTQNAPHILVVDDELSMRELLEYMLAKENYKVTCAESGKEAIARLEKDHFDLLLCDIRLGDITGLDVLRACKEHHPDNAVILISAYATTETAVEAMNEGAFDYVPKPFDKDELMATIAKALELRSIEHEKKQLDDELKKNLHFGMIVGNSPAMRHIYKLIEQVAKTKTNILITGESGTGKEVIAKAIHQESDRSDQPFMVINCGGIPETLMESELFGHKKGSFTGATNDKKGLFEIAHKGTVFLDEIGELSLPIQVKLLRAVQEKVFKPVGGNEDIYVDIRIIAATNKSLEKEVINGNFREDLFYRQCHLSENAKPICAHWPSIFLKNIPRKWEKRSPSFLLMHLIYLRNMISPAIFGSLKTFWNAVWHFPPPISFCRTAWPFPFTNAAGSKDLRIDALIWMKSPGVLPWIRSLRRLNAGI